MPYFYLFLTVNDFDISPFNNAPLQTVRTQVTRTHYEAPPQYVGTIPDFTPENLRNRVAVVTYATDPQNGSFDMATHYSYDIAGNVKTIVHNIPQLANQIYVLNGSTRNHRYKRLDYDYDLVSGKVNKLHYQKGEPDYFVYRYDYDPDNRLQFANSSIDDNCWILEASYFYYKHGPLSRIELGRNFNKVQGMDYAYTLQGWIKGLNASFLDPNRDMGKDGIGTSTVRKDAVGYTINYFDDDYKPIGATAKTDAGRFDVKMTNSSGDYRSKGLFNGNIRSIASQTEGLGNPILMSYDYDQLNRLNKMESNALTINTNTWNRATPAESRWREDVTYDANGNIKAYKRNDQFGTVLMDNLQYSYKPNTNQLASVADYAPPSTYKDDVEGITGNTFQYDKIGNLTYETKNGSRSVSFNWNVYGKMLTAYDWDYDAQNVVVASYAQYSYDAQQNRFKKQQTTSRLVNSVWQNQTSTDYYIRDAQGNILAIYQAKDNNFVWKEQHLYGSSRLGMWQPEKVLSGVVLPMLGVCGDGQGVRLYELTNHLGNVLATINDKGKVVSAQDYYPFGLKLDGRMFNTEGYRFGFNGKEYDGAFKQLDFGDRMYRDNLGRWLLVDPLAAKYTSLSPYHFGFCNPITTVDRDGRENIIVVGGQYQESAGNKLMFMNQAIKKMNEYKFNEPRENTTILLYAHGYTQNQIHALQEVADKSGVRLQLVNTADEVVNYVNSKDVSCSDISDGRNADKTTNVDVFSHGTPGGFDLGYELPTAATGRFSYNQAMALKPEAFDAEKATLTSFACRTGAGANLLRYNYLANSDKTAQPSSSLAQSIADNAKITVWALICRSEYENTISTDSERSKIRYGKMPYAPGYAVMQGEKLDAEITQSQLRIDGKVFMPNGARYGVEGGDTPVGTSNDLKIFKPGYNSVNGKTN